MGKKTAVIVTHGIGEQIPMETLGGFVDSVWTTDRDLVRESKPDPDTGEDGPDRRENASWYKPDERTRNFDLRLITTESMELHGSSTQKRVDFFEFYWAHRTTGTWEMVKGWVLGLMLRPRSKVPVNLRQAQILMWVLLAIFLAVWALIVWLGKETPIVATIGGLAWTALSGWAVPKLTGHVGDIVRYVRPSPQNIAARQAIREDGVRMLETLMGVNADGTRTPSQYDRIIMVGHSLGTIVAYDVLTHAFGRLNTAYDPDKLASSKQPALAGLEDVVREAWLTGKPLDRADYRARQDAARREMNAAGHPWIVSDFISLGSPLTHAEFLSARDREHLDRLQRTRVFPTCPPELEYHRDAPHYHFTYQAAKAFGWREDVDASFTDQRVPHHAAPFAFTRWTNIYSPMRNVLWGDIVSGPLCGAFGLKPKSPDGGETGEDRPRICGIEDIAVLPADGGTGEAVKRRLFTHLLYWDRTVAREHGKDAPDHIEKLRRALDLKQEDTLQ